MTVRMLMLMRMRVLRMRMRLLTAPLMLRRRWQILLGPGQLRRWLWLDQLHAHLQWRRQHTAHILIVTGIAIELVGTPRALRALQLAIGIRAAAPLAHARLPVWTMREWGKQ